MLAVLSIILLSGKAIKSAWDTTAKIVSIVAGSTIIHKNFSSGGSSDEDKNKNDKNNNNKTNSYANKK